MGDDGLKEGFVRNPCGAEEADHIGTPRYEGQQRLDRAATQAPPLAADAHAQVLRHLAGDPQPFLQVHRGVEQPFVLPFVEPVAVDQPFLLDPRLDPVRGEEIQVLDMVEIIRLEPGADMFGRLDRHAVAGQQVEMRGAGKGRQGGAGAFQRGGDQAPFAPAAFDPAAREGHAGVLCQRGADPGKICRAGAGIEMDRDAIAGGRQPQGLGDDPLGVLVAQQDIGDLRHQGSRQRCERRSVSLNRGALP